MDCNRWMASFQAVNISKENKGLFRVSGADFIQQRGVGHEQRVVKQGQLGDNQHVTVIAVAPLSHLLDAVDSGGMGSIRMGFSNFMEGCTQVWIRTGRVSQSASIWVG